MTGRMWICVGAIFCGLAVGTGAFAAHGLNKVFPEKYAGMTRELGGQTVPLATKFLADFKTGAEYHMYHGLAIIVVGLIMQQSPSFRATIAALAFSLGIVLFSGSLYVLTLTGETLWGAVTPIGGLLFLIGWFFLAAAAVSRSVSTNEKARLAAEGT